MADYNWFKMSPEEIENLFLTTEVSPNSPTVHYALQALEIKYKRMDAERSRRALWISIIALAISLVGIVVNAFGAEERYLCVADMATGFKCDSNTKKWQQVNFSVEQEKFIITKSQSPKGVLEMKEVGDNFALCHSEKGFQDSDVAAFGCGCGEIKFNNKTGRYLRTSSCGYIGGDESKFLEFTPYIEIGKCSPF